MCLEYLSRVLKKFCSVPSLRVRILPRTIQQSVPTLKTLFFVIKSHPVYHGYDRHKQMTGITMVTIEIVYS